MVRLYRLLVLDGVFFMKKIKNVHVKSFEKRFKNPIYTNSLVNIHTQDPKRQDDFNH